MLPSISCTILHTRKALQMNTRFIAKSTLIQQFHRAPSYNREKDHHIPSHLCYLHAACEGHWVGGSSYLVAIWLCPSHLAQNTSNKALVVFSFKANVGLLAPGFQYSGTAFKRKPKISHLSLEYIFQMAICPCCVGEVYYEMNN